MKSLSAGAKLLIISAIIVGTILIAYQFFNLKELSVWVFLLAGIASVAQVFKEEGSTEKSSYNLSWLVYGFTFAIFGAPSTMLVIAIAHIVEWFYHKYPWYIQMYNIATYAIAVTGAGWVSMLINPAQELLTLAGTLAMLTGLIVFTGINHFLIGVVIWAARGQDFSQSGVFGFLTLMIDFTVMALGVGSAMIWEISPFAIIFVLAPLVIIQSGLKIPRLKRQTETDPKTGLFNANYFATEFEKLLDHANRYNRPLSVIMGDLDLLRNINNTYGHLAGDIVLQGVANILRVSFRDYDLVARFGGEEFAILLPETRPEDAIERIEAVRKEIEASEFEVDTSITPIKATMSFGISGLYEVPGQNASSSDLINDADAALYNAKLAGRNNTRLFLSQLPKDPADLLNIQPTSAHIHGQERSPIASRLRTDFEPLGPNPFRESESSKSVPETHKTANNHKHQPTGVNSKQPMSVNLYIGIVALVAIGLAIFGISQTQSPNYWGILLFSLLIMFTEGLSIEIYTKDSSVSTAAAPLIAGTLLFGPLAGLILSLVIAGTAAIKKSSNPTRLVFNTSNHFISSSLVVIFASIIRIPFTDIPAGLQLLITLLSGVIVFLSSTVILSGVLHFSKKHPFLGLWKEHFSWLLPYYIALGILSYAIILGFTFAGIFGLTAIMVPLLMLRISQVQYIENTKMMVGQLHSKNDELETNNQVISRFNEDILHSLANILDLRDSYTMGHSESVADIATQLAKKMRLSDDLINSIATAGLLHDIGKIGIPDSILFKPTQLTFEEYEIIKEHPVRGAEILDVNQSLHYISPIVRHHHERYDGRGYPQGLQGEAIPIEARIMCLADSIQAMMSNRPYRKGLGIQETITEIKAKSGTQFDPQVVNIALEILLKDRNAFSKPTTNIIDVQSEYEQIQLLRLHNNQ